MDLIALAKARRSIALSCRRDRLRPGIVIAAMLLIATAASQAASAQDAPPAAGNGQSAGKLAIGTWGGAYGQSQQIAYFDPFTQATGTKLTVDTYDGSAAALKAKIGTSSPYDVVDLSAGVLDALCHDNLLEPIDSSILAGASGGQNVTDDFIGGSLAPCGIPSVAWSTVIAYDRHAFPKSQPSKIGDLLDLQHFAGKRALPNGPRYTLELALLADGVDPDAVYSQLATPDGVTRAFHALDRIKSSILWWDKSQDALDWLSQKKAVMALGYSGRVFRTAVSDRQHLGLLWDGQIYDIDYWAIPKSAAHKDDAKRFIAFASDPARLAAQAALTSYGPLRKSAIAAVGKNPAVDIDMKDFLPTAPGNFGKALKFDAAWWDIHSDELTKRFQEWREQASTAEGTSSAAGQAQPQ